MQNDIRIIPLRHITEIKTGINIAHIIEKGLIKQQLRLEDNDIIVITQKIVSKAEGRIIALNTIKPSVYAHKIAKTYKKDPRYIEIVLQETKRIVRMDRGIIISETQHGYICANAGVDASNVGKKNAAALLPLNPDNSAKLIRNTLQKDLKLRIAVVISDTWGRPWREGQVNFSIGSSGINVLTDYQGEKDANGYTLKVSLLAIADELASAAELVMGKTDGVPVAIIRGFTFKTSEKGSKELIRERNKDLFR